MKGLRQVIKDIGAFVNSMNSLGHAPKMRDGEHAWKMKMTTHTKPAMTKQTITSQKLEKLFPG
jgi:hypothetical protein